MVLIGPLLYNALMCELIVCVPLLILLSCRRGGGRWLGLSDCEVCSVESGDILDVRGEC